MRWYKTEKKLPKKIDYYLISDGKYYSVGIFFTTNNIFVDRNSDNPIPSENIKYWKKIPLTPREEKLNIPITMFRFL